MLTDNVLSVYRSARLSAITDGMTWYSRANLFARSLDDNVERAAGIIAALSPMSSWENNKMKAIQFYYNGPVGCGLSKNVAKAERIYAGEHPLDVLGGDKVRAFYSTIVEPFGENLTAVIDRHAFDVAEGRVTSDKERSALGRKGVYATYAEAYNDAAAMVNIPVQALQAITWVEWRERIGKGWAG